jgi:hypothetical protein
MHADYFLVTPGLDPGVHPMDGRVKPGHDVETVSITPFIRAKTNG